MTLNGQSWWTGSSLKFWRLNSYFCTFSFEISFKFIFRQLLSREFWTIRKIYFSPLYFFWWFFSYCSFNLRRSSQFKSKKHFPYCIWNSRAWIIYFIFTCTFWHQVFSLVSHLLLLIYVDFRSTIFYCKFYQLILKNIFDFS